MSLATLVAVLLPVQQNWRSQPRDSFPLSYYPMYAKRTAVESAWYVEGVSGDGARHRILDRYYGIAHGSRPIKYWQVGRLISAGRAQEFCQVVAMRVSRSAFLAQTGVRTIRVIVAEFEPSEFMAGRTAPRSERIVAACEAAGRHGS